MAVDVRLSDRPVVPGVGPSDRAVPTRESSRDRRDPRRPQRRRPATPASPDSAEEEEPEGGEEGKGTRIDIRA